MSAQQTMPAPRRGVTGTWHVPPSKEAMVFIAIVKQVNRAILNAQEEALVWVLHRITNRDEDVERLARYQMDAVQEFADKHPLQCWNPAFLLFPGLGRELMDGINQSRVDFVANEGRHREEWNPTPRPASPEMSMRIVEALERSSFETIDLETLRARFLAKQREIDPDYRLTDLSDLVRNLKPLS